MFNQKVYLILFITILISIFILINSTTIKYGTLTLLYFIFIFINFRPKFLLHPSNFIFSNYMIYLVMPHSIFLIYELFNISYILPWGMINDWSKVSGTAYVHFGYAFTTLFIIPRILISDWEIQRVSKYKNYLRHNTLLSQNRILILLLVVFVLLYYFIINTGGINKWLGDYSETYLNNKTGLGELNMFLIFISHFIAFLLGFTKFVLNRKIGKRLIICAFIIILISMYVQGIKSRLPIILFFYCAPFLLASKFKFIKSMFLFIFLICLFLIGMYFRSDGFYNSPRLGIEYLMSYFNTIFLHDLVLKDYSSGELNSLLISLNKFKELFGDKVPREQYDLAVYLTQIYYPNDWYLGGATQQWPIETDLYLTLPFLGLWLVPITLYCLIFVVLFKNIDKGCGYIIFIYSCELVRIMSVFRSSFLTWDIWPLIILYIIGYFIWNWIFKFNKNVR